jgi:hypothetical protein
MTSRRTCPHCKGRGFIEPYDKPALVSAIAEPTAPTTLPLFERSLPRAERANSI